MSQVLQFPVPDQLRDAESGTLRRHISRAREAAHRRACDYRSLDAGHISHIASQFAASWAFQRTAPLEQLAQVLDILDHLLRGAEALEKLEGCHAQ